MKKPDPIPSGVKRAMAVDAAGRKKGSPGVAAELAGEYGLTQQQAKRFLDSHREKIDDLRGKISEGALMLAGQALSRISEKLSDDAAMAETPLKDLAMTQEKLVNAAVTAAEGHRPQVQINLGQALERDRRIQERDRRLQEMKRAQSA